MFSAGVYLLVLVGHHVKVTIVTAVAMARVLVAHAADRTYNAGKQRAWDVKNVARNDRQNKHRFLAPPQRPPKHACAGEALVNVHQSLHSPGVFLF